MRDCLQVRKIVDSAYARTVDLLTEKKYLVEKLALALLEREVHPSPTLFLLLEIVSTITMG